MTPKSSPRVLGLSAALALASIGLTPAEAQESPSSVVSAPTESSGVFSYLGSEADNYYMLSYDSHDDDQQVGVEYEVIPFYAEMGESEQTGLPSGVRAVLDFADPRLNARLDETTGSIFYRLDSIPTEDTTYKLKVIWYFQDGSSQVIEGAVYYTLPGTLADKYEMRSSPLMLVKSSEDTFALPSFHYKNDAFGWVFGGSSLTYEVIKQDEGLTVSIDRYGRATYSFDPYQIRNYSFTWRATAEDGSSLDATTTLVYDPLIKAIYPVDEIPFDTLYTLGYTTDKYNQEVGATYRHAPVFWSAGMGQDNQSTIPGTRYDLLAVSNPALEVSLDAETGIVSTRFTQGNAGDRGWVMVRALYPDGTMTYKDFEVVLGQQAPATAYAPQFKVSYPTQPQEAVKVGQENRLALTKDYIGDPDSEPYMTHSGLAALRGYLVDAPAELKARVDLESGDLLYTLDALPAQDTTYPVTIKLVFRDGSSALKTFDLLVKGQNQQEKEPEPHPAPVQPEPSPSPEAPAPAPSDSAEPSPVASNPADQQEASSDQQAPTQAAKAPATSSSSSSQQAGQQAHQSQLARTGLNATGIFATGLLLLAAGSALILRRRSA